MVLLILRQKCIISGIIIGMMVERRYKIVEILLFLGLVVVLLLSFGEMLIGGIVIALTVIITILVELFKS